VAKVTPFFIVETVAFVSMGAKENSVTGKAANTFNGLDFELRVSRLDADGKPGAPVAYLPLAGQTLAEFTVKSLETQFYVFRSGEHGYGLLTIGTNPQRTAYSYAEVADQLQLAEQLAVHGCNDVHFEQINRICGMSLPVSAGSSTMLQAVIENMKSGPTTPHP